MGTYRKTEGIQSCLRIWGSYDPIEWSPSEPKKWGYMGVAWKKADLWTKMGPKMGSHKLYNGQIFETKSAHCSNIISKNVETSKNVWEVLKQKWKSRKEKPWADTLCGSTLIQWQGPKLKIVAVSFFCNASSPLNFFLNFHPTLTANNSGLKPSKLKNYNIFGILRTSALTWYHPI